MTDSYYGTYLSRAAEHFDENPGMDDYDKVAAAAIRLVDKLRKFDRYKVRKEISAMIDEFDMEISE